MDVYVVNEGILRYCSQCSLSTVWKITTGKANHGSPTDGATTPRIGNAPPATVHPEIQLPVDPAPGEPARPEAASVPVAPVAAAGPPTRPQPNRRRERRTQVKFNACIRTSGWGEEIVPCEDMSRGGFSFRSKRQHSVGTMIEAAVPYEPGTSIFVPAQIANVSKLQGGELFRYGVAYIRSPKDSREKTAFS